MNIIEELVGTEEASAIFDLLVLPENMELSMIMQPVYAILNSLRLAVEMIGEILLLASFIFQTEFLPTVSAILILMLNLASVKLSRSNMRTIMVASY